MSKAKPKFYVVWDGRRPGIYTSWPEASEQVSGYAGAKYKGFPSRDEAEAAYRGNYWAVVGKNTSSTAPKTLVQLEALGVDLDGVAVDAACAGVPGPMEYQGVEIRSGEHLFHEGPMPDGTNNVGEFLALVDALAILKDQKRPNVTIYSDSVNAQLWVRAKQCRTKLEPTNQNGPIFVYIDRAVSWLRENRITNPIVKWETDKWGEIPADFGRK